MFGLGTLATVLRGRLPAGLARYYPPSQRLLPLRRVDADGVLHTAGGRVRAVLRLTGEALDDDRAALGILQTLAAAINTTRGTVTLLAYGKPGGLAHALQQRQDQALRLEALAAAPSPAPQALPGVAGRAALARAQVAHLQHLAGGHDGEDRRGARLPGLGLPGPVRRYGFYLVLEAATRPALGRLVQEQIDAWGAGRVAGREAVAIEAEAWRGLPLPPEHGGLLLWRTHDPDGAELEIAPRREGGAVVRTGRSHE